MHVLLAVLATDGILCIAGVAAMTYWAWRAVPDPGELGEVSFGEAAESIFSRPVSAVESTRYAILKRTIDILFAALLLAIGFIPGCIIACLIVATSRGPVFYREKRIGRYGYFFRIWKFRSMYQDADRRTKLSEKESAEAQLFWRMRKSELDPRITRVGHILRRWSLDELPQVLNVLKGEMSIVGPRPIIEAELGVYGDLIHRYVEARPGLTGLWQISGRSNVGYDRRSELDAHYVTNWSLKQDCQILLRTIPVVLKRIGAK